MRFEMKILILGSTGMLGTELLKLLSPDHEVIAPDKQELDIISWDSVTEVYQTVSPDLVINCVGYTNVDGCENEEFMVRKTNVEGPRNLAQSCARFECKLIHISCDYVFDGKKMMPQPYFEDDMPRPLNAYGKSKVESEVAVRENSPNYFIVRTGWLYGMNGHNFLKSVVTQSLQKKAAVVSVAEDYYGSPTWAYRLALQIGELIREDARGTYHATAEDYCSRIEYAKFIINKMGLKASIAAKPMSDLYPQAMRPANCLLENSHLKKQGICVMKDWKEDLDTFLERHGEELIKEARTRKS